MTLRSLNPSTARRLAITRQRLAGPVPKPNAEGILSVIRDLSCLQLDPTSAVARSHLLVLWSRLGNYDPGELDKLLWQERKLFEYWAHAASIVLTENYPIHADLMRHNFQGRSAWHERTRQWIAANADLRDHILSELKDKGPLSSKHFEDKSIADWYSMGWTSGRNVSRMLDLLWTQGTILVYERRSGHRYWHLAEHCLPEWTPREQLDRHEVVRRATQTAIRALGVARPNHIKQHFTRNRYDGLNTVLKELENEGRIQRVRIADDGNDWPGPWYIHTQDLPLLDRIEAEEWQPRTTLLSPFDNLICDRARTEKLFNYKYRIEIYVPKTQRKYGYFVLPILHGDQLIGRIDPLMNRKHGQLLIHAVYAEPDAPMNVETGQAVAKSIEELATFLKAREIVYGERKPEGWKKALR